MNENADESKSRGRGNNFKAVEKDLLMRIANKYRNIVENKATTAEYNDKKRECWELIANEFNAEATTGQRNVKQMKYLYDSIKQKIKKKVALENKNRCNIISASKASRGNNYSASEKGFLIRVTNKYRNVLMNKETSAEYADQKRECWELIANEFNAKATTGQRTAKQIKNWYENFKQSIKKMAALENKYSIKNVSGSNASNASTCSQKNEYNNLSVSDDSNASNFSTYSQTKRYNSLSASDASNASTYSQKKMYKSLSASSASISSQESLDIPPISKDSSMLKYLAKKLENAKLESKYLKERNRREKSLYNLQRLYWLSKLGLSASADAASGTRKRVRRPAAANGAAPAH